ncbi:DUF3168 domain-containing protein [Neorhizobium petrolearium]|uniref:DUF3168 domain-containing protein n=1 Tax=Neorhizobium petrolearium TaxID=515361 RepID=UPI003F7E657B
MEPSLELQKAIRSRLVAATAVTALVPAANIVDRNGTPATFPSILIGEGQTVPGGDIARTRHDAYLDLHIWQKETGLAFSKQVAGTIRDALKDTDWTATGLHVVDLHVASSRFMRDPNGTHSHGVLSLTANVLEVL